MRIKHTVTEEIIDDLAIKTDVLARAVANGLINLPLSEKTNRFPNFSMINFGVLCRDTLLSYADELHVHANRDDRNDLAALFLITAKCLLDSAENEIANEPPAFKVGLSEDPETRKRKYAKYVVHMSDIADEIFSKTYLFDSSEARSLKYTKAAGKMASLAARLSPEKSDQVEATEIWRAANTQLATVNTLMALTNLENTSFYAPENSVLAEAVADLWPQRFLAYFREQPIEASKHLHSVLLPEEGKIAAAIQKMRDEFPAIKARRDNPPALKLVEPNPPK